MADKRYGQDADSGEVIIAKAKDFWERYSRPVTIICTLIIVLAGGWFIYKSFFKNPKEEGFGKHAIIEDPDGHLISIVKLKSTQSEEDGFDFLGLVGAE